MPHGQTDHMGILSDPMKANDNRLITIPISHYCEKARWALEWSQIPYVEEKHLQVLENFFKEINHHIKYDAYPTVMYHGYHQRRVGCFSGSRSIYIDSAGDVHACPFCHTKSFNIIHHLRSNQQQLPRKENSCPLFNKIA